MTFEERLENYTDADMLTLRKNKGKDGLTGAQRRALLKKDRKQFVRSQEGETT